MTEIQGKSILVRVSEGSSCRESIVILHDKAGTYEVLLESLDKSFQAATPAYISALFTPRTNINGLRGINKLQLPRVNTTSYGKNSFKFLAPKLWNVLNDDLRTTTNITYFGNELP